jgi:hypothetical protein
VSAPRLRPAPLPLGPLAVVGLACLLAAWPSAARAGGPLGAEDSRIRTSRYAIDFYSGQVVSASRVIGLAGSFSAIAEGVDAVPINPAAAAVRVPWSYHWFDYDLTLGISFPTAILGSDVENLGLRAAEYRYDGYYVPSIGLLGSFGRTGIGLTVEDRRYSLTSSTSQTPSSGADRYAASLYSVHAVVARSVWRGQLTFGVGLRLVGFSLIDESTKATRLAMTGISAETGVLVAPTDSHFRLGLVGRLPVSARPQADSELKPNADGDLVAPGDFYFPQSVEVPWEAELSLAVELGERPLNPRWENPDEYTRPLRAELSRAREIRAARHATQAEEDQARLDERQQLEAHEADLTERRRYAHQHSPRTRKLLTATVLLTGPVSEAVAPVSLLRQTVTRSGQGITVTPRLGLEVEPIENWVQMRLGLYLEPGRAAQANARLHFTTGFDVKLFPWSVFGLYHDSTWWSVGAVVDVADRYNNVAFRVGVWR